MTRTLTRTASGFAGALAHVATLADATPDAGPVRVYLAGGTPEQADALRVAGGTVWEQDLTRRDGEPGAAFAARVQADTDELSTSDLVVLGAAADPLTRPLAALLR